MQTWGGTFFSILITVEVGKNYLNSQTLPQGLKSSCLVIDNACSHDFITCTASLLIKNKKE